MIGIDGKWEGIHVKKPVKKQQRTSKLAIKWRGRGQSATAVPGDESRREDERLPGIKHRCAFFWGKKFTVSRVKDPFNEGERRRNRKTQKRRGGLCAKREINRKPQKDLVTIPAILSMPIGGIHAQNGRFCFFFVLSFPVFFFLLILRFLLHPPLLFSLLLFLIFRCAVVSV